MTKKPLMMGITIYLDSVRLGKAMDITLEGDSVTIGLGSIDRFEVLRHLSPRVARDLIGEKPIPGMPQLTLYCEPQSIKTKRKLGEGLSRITFKPVSIEVTPMPGKNLGIKFFKGTIVGNIDSGVKMPDEVAPTSTSEVNDPTILY